MVVVIELKGKQYRVEPEQVIRSLRVDGEVGDKIEADRVLAAIDGENVKLGTPVVEGAKVTLEIVRQTKSPKLSIFKYQARKRVARRIGYRDNISYLRVKQIEV